MSKSDVALLVSILSATFTAVGLLLQVFLHRLDGPRIEVRLIPAVVTEYNSIFTGADGGWKNPNSLGTNIQPPFVELAVVQASILGRSPITVSDIMLWP